MNAGPVLLAVVVLLGGVALVVWATERLVHGMIGLSGLLRVAPFAVSAVLGGMEAENVAVGLAAGSRGAVEVALGTVFGGSILLVCVALGIGAMVAPLRVALPRSVLAVFALAPVAAGIPLAFGGARPPRWAGALLLLLFAAAMAVVVRASRTHQFIDDDEIEEAREKPPSVVRAVVLTVLGIGVIAVGGELVSSGATRLIADAGLSAGLVGMVLTPVVVESDEIIRQVVPAREGRHDVSAGNAVGTLLWFTLFNLGLIALITPVAVPRLVRVLDYPFMVGATWIATAMLARGRVGRAAGALLVALAVAYAVLRGVLR